MLRRLTARQFREWARFAEVEPFSFDGQARVVLMLAQVAQVIANVNRGKGQKAYSLQDFMLKFHEGEKPKQKTWQEMQKIAYMIAAAYNAPGVTS